LIAWLSTLELQSRSLAEPASGGHGLSIGSVGGRDDNTVDTVTIESSTVTDSANGIRIKTVSGATGTVSGVDLQVHYHVWNHRLWYRYRQDYENGSSHLETPTDGVPITDLTSRMSPVLSTQTQPTSNILCASGACSDWTWSGVSVTGGKTSSDCSKRPKRGILLDAGRDDGRASRTSCLEELAVIALG